MPTTWTNEIFAGYLPEIFHDNLPRTAREQIETNYAHGGGYLPIHGFETLTNYDKPGKATMTYPEDPEFTEQSRTYLPLTKETLILFQVGMVAIVQDDGSFVVVRMD